MATIREFEEALSKKGVQIHEMEQAMNLGVIKVTGYIVKKFIWDKDGKAYTSKNERMVDLDIKFEDHD